MLETTSLVIVGAIVLLLLWVARTYNRLVWRRNRVRNGWAQIDVQLLRRAELIPNLVEVVRGYLVHERSVLDQVTQARTRAVAAGDHVAARAQAEGELAATTRQLFAVVEGYPQLRAVESVLALQEDLVATENRIAFARQHYNDEVQEFNTAVESFPGNLVAGSFGFRLAVTFALDDDAMRSVPRVQL